MLCLSFGIRRAAATLCVASLITTNSYAESPCPVHEVRSALKGLDRWLTTNQSGPRLREELRTDQLLEQLEKGEQADPEVLATILRHYALEAPATDQPAPLRVRRALEGWLPQLPPPALDELSAAARAAKAVFVPPTEADVQDAESELLAAVDRLDKRLNAAGPEAAGWREYLRWDALADQLARGTDRDLAALDAIYSKFAAGHEGLELIWFDDVREALRHYLTTARAIGDPKLQAAYAILIDALVKHLDTYRQQPTVEGATAIRSAIQWLEEAGQARWLVAGIRHHFVNPNFFVQASHQLVAAGIEGPLDDVQPVHDCILGTSIHGTGHTTGQVSVALVPDTAHARFGIMFSGTVESDTVGYNGPARIYSGADARLETQKPIWLSDEGFAPRAAVSNASLRSTVKSVRAGRGGLIQRIATKRVYKQKGRADWIAARHAEQRANRQANRQAHELIDEAQQSYLRKFRRPLLDRKLFPRRLDFATTLDRLLITGLQVGRYDLAAAGSPPEPAAGKDLTVRFHESAINNFAQAAYAGRVIKEERFQEELVDLLGELPEKLKPESGSEPWIVAFAPRLPISMSFGDDQFSLTFRGREYTVGENSYPGMNVSATYKIEPRTDGFVAIRQGPLQIFPPGFVPGSGRQLSVRQQVMRNLLERRLGKVLQEEIVPQEPALPVRWKEAGKLALDRWEAADGWMVLCWKWIPLPTTAENSE